jgi:hypothetical protein
MLGPAIKSRGYGERADPAITSRGFETKIGIPEKTGRIQEEIRFLSLS